MVISKYLGNGPVIPSSFIGNTTTYLDSPQDTLTISAGKPVFDFVLKEVVSTIMLEYPVRISVVFEIHIIPYTLRYIYAVFACPFNRVLIGKLSDESIIDSVSRASTGFMTIENRIKTVTNTFKTLLLFLIIFPTFQTFQFFAYTSNNMIHSLF